MREIIVIVLISFALIIAAVFYFQSSSNVFYPTLQQFRLLNSKHERSNSVSTNSLIDSGNHTYRRLDALIRNRLIKIAGGKGAAGKTFWVVDTGNVKHVVWNMETLYDLGYSCKWLYYDTAIIRSYLTSNVICICSKRCGVCRSKPYAPNSGRRQFKYI